MAALDLLGRRWALRVLWELRGGPQTFRALRERCDGVSPSVLNTRLAELREAALIEIGDDGYALSEAGTKLGNALLPLSVWADAWARGSR
jgi:DNA-binding HxlR family transcriptional regulator